MEKKKKSRNIPGFYIALCCCVLAIGAAGYLSEHKSIEKANSLTENVEDTASPAVHPTIAVSTMPPISVQALIPPVTPTPVSTPVSEETIADDYTYDNPDMVQAVSGTAVKDAPVFALPAQGSIVQGFTQELMYNEFLDDWRTHDGIDIAGDKGASICCAADGKIKSISDTVYGCEVIIEHDNGYETLYSQICKNDSLTEGADVHRGDVIGTIDEPCCENVTEPHLHFEVHFDGKCIDPLSVCG